MKQNDAVFQACCEVLGANGFDSKVELTEEQRARVVAIVTDGICAGKVDFSPEAKAKHNTPELVRKYTVGMVSNHLRKDKRLNGGVQYEIQNPGSRTGQGDDTIKNLRALRSTLTDPAAVAMVDEEIAKRTAELKASKVKPKEINLEAIPEHLRYLAK